MGGKGMVEGEGEACGEGNVGECKGWGVERWAEMRDGGKGDHECTMGGGRKE